MGKKSRELESWWSGLNPDEQAATKDAADSGKLDASTRRLLEKAGVVGKGDTTDDDEIVIFLKTRH